MRIVIDTNLLVSGVISAGLPRQLVNAAKVGVFELCTSEVLLAELLDVMERQKFAQRLAQAGLTPQGIVDDLRARLWRQVRSASTGKLPGHSHHHGKTGVGAH